MTNVHHNALKIATALMVTIATNAAGLKQDINKKTSSVFCKLKNSEVLLNNSISDILFGLLTKDIKGTIAPIVINSKSEFIKITNII